MSTLGVNDGHTISGAGSGAVGRIKEGEHTRKVGNEVRRLLKERGNTVYNCTVDYASTTSESLSLVVQQANRQELDWFISIHFNAGKGEGVEVYTYEGRQYQDAIDVCNSIANVLGIPNRGVKAGTGLYVIRKTKAKSMLIEVCFVDSNDADKYLAVGYEAVAKAIVDALDQHIVVTPTVNSNSSNTTVTSTKDYSEYAAYVGNRCKELQEKLISLGYDCGDYGADGKFGKGTYESLIKFQQDYNLKVDGLAGKATFDKLDELIASKNSSYKVKIIASVLNVRKGAGTNYSIATTVKKNEVYTIVEEKNGWGKLKSGAGWISLSYTSKL